ncbi:DUF4476 domain-containing protein [Rufibacter quisquiliarum]|uniref:DUF4476 domain-containing protein n=1 Tax=Rufibacter quisquiliarum TaxID=1549639 RepID=A0A839GNP0_9BACT|nr:DUF4476 domain-containing protein [Rufibacter quisquiliarum]MBA9076048.1 hypothetical protein [Rufibacter quisquiliarum]
MNRLYVTIIAFFLFLGLVQAQVPRDAAILVESQRGELFYLAIGPRVINTVPSNRVAVGDLPAGRHWIDVRVVRRGRPLTIRAEVFLHNGYETVFVLEPARRGNFILRKVEEVPLHRPVPPVQGPVYDDCRSAMDERQVDRTLRFMKDEGFDDRRLEIAKGEIRLAGSIMTEDLFHFMKALSFEDRRVALAKYAYQFVCDRREFPRVLEALEFTSSKRELQDFIYKR